MNKRDFCFWLQGYIEITGGKHPSIAAWNLILSHLTLALKSDTKSNEHFNDAVSVLEGFISINGEKRPMLVQWERISELVSDCFNKVTPELEDLDEVEEDRDAIMDELLKRINEKEPVHPYIPNPYTPPPMFPDPFGPIPPNTQPWSPIPDVICCNEPTEDSKAFCGTVPNVTCGPSVDVACNIIDAGESLVEFARENATKDLYDQRLKGFGGDMYDKGADIATMT